MTKKMNRLQMQIAFIDELEKLKAVHRQNLTLDQGRPENSAEHSWHLALMAFILSEYSKSNQLDMLRVIKMLLIHDVVEIYDGDTFLFDDEARNHALVKEREALEKVLSLLPEDQASDMKNLWCEFEAGQTEEAQFALALDALQPVLNHRLTGIKDYNPHKLTVSRIISKKQVIKKYTPDLWTLVETALSESVDRGLYIKSD